MDTIATRPRMFIVIGLLRFGLDPAEPSSQLLLTVARLRSSGIALPISLHQTARGPLVPSSS
jgi:hypothetical protein